MTVIISPLTIAGAAIVSGDYAQQRSVPIALNTNHRAVIEIARTLKAP